MKTSCFLVLFATQVLYVCPAPTDLSSYGVSDNLDYSKAYLQFFNIKDLIEKINIKKFRELHDSRANIIEGPADAAVKEPEVTNEATVSAPEDYLPEIDLTDEAIINDEVRVTVPDTSLVENEDTTLAPTEAAIVEELVVTTTGSVVEAEITVYDDTEIETKASTAAPTAVPTEALATTKPERQESPNDLVEANVEDALLNEIDTGADKFFISKESVESAKKYGYKILLKKVNGKEVAVGKIKFSFPTLVEISTDEDDSIEEVLSTTEGLVEEKIAAEPESVATEAFEEEILSTASTVPVDTLTTGGAIIEASKTEETSIAIIENIAETTTATVEIVAELTTETVGKVTETTTALAVTYLPPPIEAVIPTVELLDENTITEGVKQITEDTEVAIKEMKIQNTTDSIVFAECTAPFADVEDMLMSLAKNIAKQTHQISEILSVGKSLKDETSPELLSRSGAKLLKLLEPFLESLLPAELSGCAGESSHAMLISLSGMASQLDTIASNEVNQDRATSLHKSATSLQLAAWVMGQLQSSVHSFYSKEGICGDKKSSTTEILGSLSRAITEYVPIVAMLGNQDSVDELKETIEALNKAQTDIEQLETKSGTSLPGIECGASFSEMAEALENLADFVKALDSNEV